MDFQIVGSPYGGPPTFHTTLSNSFSAFKKLHISLTFSQEIACFSYNEQHEFLLDDSSIRYYYPPALGADLCKGFDTFQKMDDSADDHLDSLLKTIIAHEQKLGQKIEADFITWRGMMTKVWITSHHEVTGEQSNV